MVLFQKGELAQAREYILSEMDKFTPESAWARTAERLLDEIARREEEKASAMEKELLKIEGE